MSMRGTWVGKILNMLRNKLKYTHYRFLDMHMYVTSVLQKTDMKAVALQMALDMLHEKEQRDLITGLKSRYKVL